ncbi:MAG: FAD:protein FMN transferase [Gemmatimonadetes bacterium]|nr:FAD:protein FMN transferase [Gemmatimonadota bacterium]
MSATVVEHVTTAMDTVVVVRVVGTAAEVADPRIARALDWFAQVESCCSRFDPASELSRLGAGGGLPVRVSEMLFDLLAFAIEVAEASGGAFDPTVGGALLARGADVAWRTGAPVTRPAALDPSATWRDLRLDHERRTVTLLRPLVLDLGAVAKGLAIDLAARELEDLRDFAIDAGGDLFVAGRNAERAPWSVGIRHPRASGELLARVGVSGMAVCTSGDYERHRADGGTHLHDPRARAAASEVSSATVIAPRALVADALATAAAVLGPEAGLALLRQQEVEGLIVTSSLVEYATPGWSAFAEVA